MNKLALLALSMAFFTIASCPISLAKYTYVGPYNVIFNASENPVYGLRFDPVYEYISGEELATYESTFIGNNTTANIIIVESKSDNFYTFNKVINYTTLEKPNGFTQLKIEDRIIDGIDGTVGIYKNNSNGQLLQNLQNRDLEGACRLANDYHRQNVFFPGFSPSGAVVDACSPSFLSSIFSGKPKILGDIPEDQLKALQIAAGMKYLLYVRKAKDWLPNDFHLESRLDVETATRMIDFHANYRNTLSRLKEHGTKKASVLVADNACEHCQKLKDKKYNLSKVPELPHEKCTSDYGCRCVLVTGMTFEEAIAETRK